MLHILSCLANLSVSAIFTHKIGNSFLTLPGFGVINCNVGCCVTNNIVSGLNILFS